VLKMNVFQTARAENVDWIRFADSRVVPVMVGIRASLDNVLKMNVFQTARAENVDWIRFADSRVVPVMVGIRANRVIA